MKFLLLLSVLPAIFASSLKLPESCGPEAEPFTRQSSQGLMIYNNGRKLCMQPGNPNQAATVVMMRPCQANQEGQLNRFERRQGNRGLMLAAPWYKEDGSSAGQRCLYNGDEEGGLVWTNRCNPNCPVYVWELEEVPDQKGYFMFRHKSTGRCARAEGDVIRVREACNVNDSSFHWAFIPDAE